MTPVTPVPGRASFVDGVRAVFSGAAFIARERRCWGPALVPAAIAVVLSAALIWVSFDRVGPWLSAAAVPEAESWLARAAAGALRIAVSILAAYVSVIFAAFVTPPLSAPALERLVRLQETALGLSPRASSSFWFELRCEIEAQLLVLAVLLPAWLATWLGRLLMPPLAPLLLPLDGLFVALAVAWNLLGYPLTLRGVRAGARLRLMIRHAPPVLGFGAVFAALCVVPGAAIVLLPAGVVGATRLAAKLLPHVAAPSAH